MTEESQATEAAPPPGFYDDGSGRQRWWDGIGWSEQRLGTPPPPSDSVLTDTSLTSKILTVIFPLPALFIGLLMGVFGHRHAWKICRLALIVIAIEVMLGFLLAVASGPSRAQAAQIAGRAGRICGQRASSPISPPPTPTNLIPLRTGTIVFLCPSQRHQSPLSR